MSEFENLKMFAGAIVKSYPKGTFSPALLLNKFLYF
jgi:hypothetical protein